jgi:Flp pilus assembly protein TadG
MNLSAFEADEEGGALIEFALVASTLVFLVLGVSQFGLMFYQWSQVNRLVEAGALYVMKNADKIYDLNSTFNPSAISTAVGGNALGDTLTVSGGCACPNTSGLTAAGLTAFATTVSRCSTALTCNGNTTAPVAYVLPSAQHAYSGFVNQWNIGPATARAVVRIQ